MVFPLLFSMNLINPFKKSRKNKKTTSKKLLTAPVEMIWLWLKNNFSFSN